jgi:uncharacterized protein (DUF1684 family)
MGGSRRRLEPTGQHDRDPGRPRRHGIGDVPGDLVFEVGREDLSAQALPGGDAGELWLVFGDATNGRETYGGGRYLYTDPPDADDVVVVDFNRSYNPPCVFSPYATCSLPWPANRLPIRIEAGERAYRSH